ncbi:DUF1748-domain-containing protein [Patellaria atrata CBS 101060]|uniref:DUF1748-domain-containing protein n=1 Tax=Patellaria atrata CBS 101060 TaxID=1346257 RepID=A0A9P4S6A3_9PEZI|nr:DUF1748-domain-containing protein [Patellaria atrata CBS 101060]
MCLTSIIAVRPDTYILKKQLGRLTHYAFDAVLLSCFLAGVKRSTGLTPSLKQDAFNERSELKRWVDNYLWVGEVVMDQSVALMSSSGYFERKR